LNIRMVILGGMGLSLLAGLAQAGDWRELPREAGAAVAVDRLSFSRRGSQLTLDMMVAMLPERLLPIYGISQVVIQCDIKTVAIGGMQFYLANGDPFGARTAALDSGPFTGTDPVGALCDGDLPPGPGADSALAFFKSVQVVAD
jgi:hypothetical protein